MINYYGEDADYIHLKFGDMRKMYHFTDEFRSKHPNFCAEYAKYWDGDNTCKFRNPLEIANYVEYYAIPVHFYFNFTDTPAKDIKEVKEYLGRETMPADYGKYNLETGKMTGWDGETEAESSQPEPDAAIQLLKEAHKVLGSRWFIEGNDSYNDDEVIEADKKIVKFLKEVENVA